VITTRGPSSPRAVNRTAGGVRNGPQRTVPPPQSRSLETRIRTSGDASFATSGAASFAASVAPASPRVSSSDAARWPRRTGALLRACRRTSADRWVTGRPKRGLGGLRRRPWRGSSSSTARLIGEMSAGRSLLSDSGAGRHTSAAGSAPPPASRSGSVLSVSPCSRRRRQAFRAIRAGRSRPRLRRRRAPERACAPPCCCLPGAKDRADRTRRPVLTEGSSPRSIQLRIVC